jgi:hypothetical protein
MIFTVTALHRGPQLHWAVAGRAVCGMAAWGTQLLLLLFCTAQGAGIARTHPAGPQGCAGGGGTCASGVTDLRTGAVLSTGAVLITGAGGGSSTRGATICACATAAENRQIAAANALTL